jgi:hypothetical protein
MARGGGGGAGNALSFLIGFMLGAAITYFLRNTISTLISGTGAVKATRAQVGTYDYTVGPGQPQYGP